MLGLKENKEINPMPIERISSGGIIFDKELGVLLIFKRSTGEYLIPNGEVLEGEALSDAAIREVLEETGYKTKVVEKIDMSEYTYTWVDGKTYHKKEHHFLLELEGRRKHGTKKLTHEDYINKWLSLDKAIALATYKDAKECLVKLRRLLK